MEQRAPVYVGVLRRLRHVKFFHNEAGQFKTAPGHTVARPKRIWGALFQTSGSTKSELTLVLAGGAPNSTTAGGYLIWS
jgi:hypothetical protein